MTALSRGLLLGLDEDRLKARLALPVYRELWDCMAREWRHVAGRVTAGNGSFTYGALGWYSISPLAIEAALLYRWGGDPEALRYLRERIAHLVAIHDDPASHMHKLPAPKEVPIHSYGELALAADLCREALAGPELDGLLRIFRNKAIDYHDGDRPMLYYGSGGNIPFARLMNAAMVALVWGRDVGHPDWERVVDLGRDACILYLHNGVDAGGNFYEGPAYGHDTAFHLYLFVQLLFQHGRENLFAREPVLGRIPAASLSVLLPDGRSLINNNDMGLAAPWGMPWLPLTARHYRQPLDLALWDRFQGPRHPFRPFGSPRAWMERDFAKHPNLADGSLHIPNHALALLWWDAEEPAAPLTPDTAPTASYSAGTEVANFRTSWNSDAIYMNVQGGGRTHAAAGHAHADCGHFSVFAHGEYLAIDTGRYNVDEDQHNVVLVDGHCYQPNPAWGWSLRQGRLRGFQRHALLDYVAADAAAIKDCIWADRHLLFVRLGGDDAYVVAIDNINRDNRKHTYWWQLHTLPEHRIRIAGDRQASIEAAQARLDLHFVIPPASDFPSDAHALRLRTDQKEWGYGSSPDHHLGFHSGAMWSSGRRPRLIAELTGLNGLMMAVMAPRRRDQAPLIVTSSSPRRILRAEVNWGGGTDTILAALDHGYINLPDVRGFTELAVIRRDVRGETTGVWTVDGSPLAVSHGGGAAV